MQYHYGCLPRLRKWQRCRSRFTVLLTYVLRCAVADDAPQPNIPRPPLLDIQACVFLPESSLSADIDVDLSSFSLPLLRGGTPNSIRYFHISYVSPLSR